MSSEMIMQLNDAFRTTFTGGSVYLTRGIDALPAEEKAAIIEKVKTFSDFTEKNDPHGEHDFGSFVHGTKLIFWKIDYYDRDLKFASEDPASWEKTLRVMTIMHAEEY